ncbi:MAG TPA: PASTA domain-containing protein [Amycolatopsis sp.]|nr:PASTA domain-containing protein [Amycolatopsis sp.]
MTEAPPSGFVPDVSGLALDDATEVLAADGYATSTLEQASPTVESGVVISTLPVAGTHLNPGSTVSAIVSSGWKPRR